MQKKSTLRYRYTFNTFTKWKAKKKNVCIISKYIWCKKDTDLFTVYFVSMNAFDFTECYFHEEFPSTKDQIRIDCNANHLHLLNWLQLKTWCSRTRHDKKKSRFLWIKKKMRERTFSTPSFGNTIPLTIEALWLLSKIKSRTYFMRCNAFSSERMQFQSDTDTFGKRNSFT